MRKTLKSLKLGSFLSSSMILSWIVLATYILNLLLLLKTIEVAVPGVVIFSLIKATISTGLDLSEIFKFEGSKSSGEMGFEGYAL